jgi:tetratricopeptide (TPR) repeat protein
MLDLRTACLDDRKRELEALLEVFESPDATVVERSVRAARALPAVEPCADLDRLRAAVPDPEDPAVAAEVEQLRNTLARSRANVESGRYDRAVALAEQVTTELETASWHYPPLEAQALLTRGDAMARAGQIQESLPLLRRGTLLALRVGDRAGFVRGATDLTWEFGDSRTEYEVAHTWADLARSTLEQMGGDDELAARLHNNVGAVLTNQQRYDEALEEHRARLALVGEEDGGAFMSLANIANIYNYRGQWDEAVKTYGRAIEIATREVGPDHPSVLMIRGNLLGVMWRVGTVPAARTFGEDLLAKQREVLGVSHPTVLTTLSNLAMIAGLSGDATAELAYAKESLGLAETIYGNDSHLAVPPLLRLAKLEYERRAFEPARQYADRALRIARESRGNDHADTAYALESLGTVALNEGEYEEALEHYAEAKRIVLGSNAPPELAAIVESYSASALCLLGRPGEALEMAEIAADRFDRSTASMSDRLIARNRIVWALVDLGRLEEAVAKADEVIAKWDALAENTGGAQVARFEKMRAEVALGRASLDPEAARELAAGTNDPLFQDRVDAWIEQRGAL